MDLHVVGLAGRDAGVRLHGPRFGGRGLRAGGVRRDHEVAGGLAVLLRSDVRGVRGPSSSSTAAADDDDDAGGRG